MLFNFLWSGKQDKVKRDHAKLSEKGGGLGMTDVKTFWMSLKFSWVRRMLNTQSAWPAILLNSIYTSTGLDLNIVDLLSMGPKSLAGIGKKLENKFWKDILVDMVHFTQGAIFCQPDKILISSFWDNPLVTRNNKSIKKSDFPELISVINSISDFYEPNTNILLSKENLENRLNCHIEQNNYIELRYIIKTALQSVGLRPDNIPVISLPTQPLIINTAMLTMKGCSAYNKILVKKYHLKNDVRDREEKWSNELGTTFGISTWLNYYNFTRQIKNDNYLKWIHYQIVRNSLFTNKRVNKFKPNISPLCSYCKNNLESVSELFYECHLVTDFWLQLHQWFASFNENLDISRNTILFGKITKGVDSVNNYTILVTKIYIWKNKFNDTPLSFRALLNFLKNKLTDLQNELEYAELPSRFNKWILVFDHLREQ